MKKHSSLTSLETILELIPIAGVGIAAASFEIGKDTVPIRQDQTFREAHFRTGMYALYHYAWTITGIGYILYKI